MAVRHIVDKHSNTHHAFQRGTGARGSNLDWTLGRLQIRLHHLILSLPPQPLYAIVDTAASPACVDRPNAILPLQVGACNLFPPPAPHMPKPCRNCLTTSHPLKFPVPKRRTLGASSLYSGPPQGCPRQTSVATGDPQLQVVCQYRQKPVCRFNARHHHMVEESLRIRTRAPLPRTSRLRADRLPPKSCPSSPIERQHAHFVSHARVVILCRKETGL
jgi:hypothetical protein